MTSSSEKQHVRTLLLSIREQISKERRSGAKEALKERLHTLDLFQNQGFVGFGVLLSTEKAVLSFCSLPQEIDTSALNFVLAKQWRLLLPKVEQEQLKIYRVTNLEQDLVLSSWGILEPKPEVCLEVPLKDIPCVLVPALGFDKMNMRIGYGKGFYDRLIAQIRAIAPKTRVIGIGFHEQLFSKELPLEPHDQPLDEVFLF